jgi:7-carboxy-7-deazaguanine synthase
VPQTRDVQSKTHSTVLTGLELPVMESFYTLQGEGFHTGRPAWFIRTGGCDVGCHWCDVKESWNAEAHRPRSVNQLVRELSTHPVEIVVITGGEPLMYPLDTLTAAIRERGLKTHLETSGAYPLSGQWDWICFSPKKFKAPVPGFGAHAHELKVVIYNRHDFEWAEEHAATVGPNCRLYLQPEWSRAKQVTPAIIDYVKTHPRWAVSLQTHKYLDIP